MLKRQMQTIVTILAIQCLYLPMGIVLLSERSMRIPVHRVLMEIKKIISAADSGAAYVYGFDLGAWSQKAYVKASNAGRVDKFGNAVSLSSDGKTFAIVHTERVLMPMELMVMRIMIHPLYQVQCMCIAYLKINGHNRLTSRHRMQMLETCLVHRCYCLLMEILSLLERKMRVRMRLE